MSGELVRLAVGLPLAVLVPGLLPGARSHAVWRAALALAFVLLALLPGEPPAGAWVAGAVVVVAMLAIGDRGLPVLAPLAAAGAVAAVLFADADLVGDTLGDVAADNRALIVLAGFFAATLVGGELVATVSRPFAPRPSLEGVPGAGRAIGWLERAIIFALILIAKPEAAALVLTAKSLARLPELGKDRQFTEYFLIGTLTSVAIAAGTALATRAALGLPVDLL